MLTEQAATVSQQTEALVPDTEEMPVTSVSTNKISQPATAALKSQKVVAATAAIQPKPGSPMKLVAFAGIFLLAAVAAASIYFSAGKSPETTADPVSTPNTVAQPTPVESQQPVNTATPIEAQTPPSESAEKPPEKDGDVSDQKTKPAGKGSAPSTATAATAADHIKLGISAGNPSAALAEYKKALQLEPGNMDVHYLMGLAYQQMGQPDQALASYRKCASGTYASVAAQHVKKLERDMSKSKY
ncbi:MAG: tetratricopeptide repeat protein [Acidobacteriota bacterium]